MTNQRNLFVGIFVIFTISLFLISCNQAISEEDLGNPTGEFRFSHITGLNYETSDGIQGITKNGVFKFTKESKSISFFLGINKIGEIKPDSSILLSNLTTNKTKLANLSQVLLSIDTDKMLVNSLEVDQAKISDVKLDFNLAPQEFEDSLLRFLSKKEIVSREKTEHYLQLLNHNTNSGYGVTKPWPVPLVNQKSSDYNYMGKDTKEAACGPTSLTMLLKYYYPNSYIDMPEIYDSGIQSYTAVRATKLNKFKRINNGGMFHSNDNKRKKYDEYFFNYLKPIWDMNSKLNSDKKTLYRFYTTKEMKEKIKDGPLLVYGSQLCGFGHFMIITKLNDTEVTYNNPWEGVEVTEDIDYFVENFLHNFALGCSSQKPYATLILPKENRLSRRYTVVVDNGNNTDSGNSTYNKLIVSNYYQNWREFFHSKGAWLSPKTDTEAARWIPKLTKTGYYKIELKVNIEKTNAYVTYQVFDKNNKLIKKKTIQQKSTENKWISEIIAKKVKLSNGAYVKVSNTPAGVNIDSIKFTYIPGDEILDTDSDNDGIIDEVDNCPDISNPEQTDSNNNGIGDLCDSANCSNPVLIAPVSNSKFKKGAVVTFKYNLNNPINENYYLKIRKINDNTLPIDTKIASNSTSKTITLNLSEGAYRWTIYDKNDQTEECYAPVFHFTVKNSTSQKCIGPVDQRACGNCGTEFQVCKNGNFKWSGICEDEGVCSPGAVDSCESGKRYCDNQCNWGSCENSCTPHICSDLNEIECGEISDGCGGILYCGTCGTNEICRSNKCFPECNNECIGTEQRCENGIFKKCVVNQNNCSIWSYTNCESNMCEDSNNCAPVNNCPQECTLDSRKCQNGNIYQCNATNNCNSWEPDEVCGNNEICTGGANPYCKENCTPKNSKVCYQGDVYWLDSCGNYDGIQNYCDDNEVCENSRCITVNSCNEADYWDNLDLTASATKNTSDPDHGFPERETKLISKILPSHGAGLKLKIYKYEKNEDSSFETSNWSGNDIYVEVYDKTRQRTLLEDKHFSTNANLYYTNYIELENLNSYFEGDDVYFKVKVVSPAISIRSYSKKGSCRVTGTRGDGYCWYMGMNNTERTCKE